MEGHRQFSDDAASLAQVGRAALDAMRERSIIAKLFGGKRVELRRSLEELLAEVQQVNPRNWSEDDFAEIDEVFGHVIDALERYQIADGDKDLALCGFVGAAVKTLREARSWIAQGYSPDPQKRPSESERRKQAEQAATSLRDLFA
jgi:hypothetical protein